jgi:hypothetical protein
MGVVRNSRRRELKQLQLQLQCATKLLDELEKRSSCRPSSAVDRFPKQNCENPETRFAAFVASGMSKIQSSVK